MEIQLPTNYQIVTGDLPTVVQLAKTLKRTHRPFEIVAVRLNPKTTEEQRTVGLKLSQAVYQSLMGV
jgi:hypothetical protein